MVDLLIEHQSSRCDASCVGLIRVADKVDAINQRLNDGDNKFDLLSQLLEEIKALRGEVAKTNDIVEAWGNIKGFGKTLKAISVVLKVTATIIAAVVSIYFIFLHPREAIDHLKGLAK